MENNRLSSSEKTIFFLEEIVLQILQTNGDGKEVLRRLQEVSLEERKKINECPITGGILRDLIPLLKYFLFDLEATKRENLALRTLLHQLGD